MQQLHTVSLGFDGINEVNLPRRATVLGVAVDISQTLPTLIVQSDTEEPNETRMFYVTASGRIPFEANGIEQLGYVGSVQAFPSIAIPKHVLEVARAKGPK